MLALATERFMTNVRKFLIQLDGSLWGRGGEGLSTLRLILEAGAEARHPSFWKFLKEGH